jgi:maltooligosyltrehalose trehalohydrolase
LQNHDQIGNRAFGERLSRIADLRRIRLARAILLLSPQIPMLFMGEECKHRTRSCISSIFHMIPVLSNAVRKGRSREFGRFKAFATAESCARIPDPTVEDTFTRLIGPH